MRNALVLATLAIFAQPMVAAAAEGDWIFRAGVGNVNPKDNNATLPGALGPPLGGAEIDVDSATSATFELVYMFADRWGVELFAPWVFNHDVEVAGTSDIADVDLWPAVLGLQYHFNPDGRFRPYVGAGLNYSTFSSENAKGVLAGADLELDESFGAAAQVGADIGLGENWLLNLGVRWIDLDSDVKVNGADIVEAEIDPFVYQAQVGYRFGRAAPAVAAAAVPVAAAPPPPPPPPPPAPPPDSDGDGVVDADDLCPDTPKGERVGKQGCSCDVTRQVQFAFGSAKLTDEGRETLEEVAENLTRLKFVSGTVTGHTDSVGPEDYNQRLSERRAQSVVDFLESKGIAVGRLTARGKGESDPIADNNTAEGRALNRRVVLRRTDCDE
jgi:outer membrane protein W